MDLIPYRIASGSDRKAEDHLWVGVLAVLGPARDADIFLAGLKVHGRGVIEHNGYITAKDLLGMVVGHPLHIALHVVRACLPHGPGPVAQLVKIAVDPVLVVVHVHEVRHIAQRPQLAPRAVKTRHHKALEYLVVGCPDRPEPYPVKQAAIDEIWSYQS